MRDYSFLSRFRNLISVISNIMFSFFFLRKKVINVITGADTTHYRSLLQLINSLKIIEKVNFNLIVYDLGFTNDELIFFKYLHPELLIKKFDFNNFPQYYNIKLNSGNYAWKPAIINIEYNLLSRGSYVLWLDAGCFVHKPLFLVKAAIYFRGFYSPFSGPKIKELTYSFTIKEMGLTNHENKKMLSGGVLGLKVGIEKNNILVNKWLNASNDINLIAPLGSNRDNHRQDQSLLSLLYYDIYNIRKAPLLSHKWLEIAAHKDIG